jgi:hypothetical protein
MKRAMSRVVVWFLRSDPFVFRSFAIMMGKEGCRASSTVNQTAIRGLVTSIIHHSSGGTSI